MTFDRKPNRLMKLSLAAAVAAGGFLAATPDAHACGGGWWPEPEIDHRVYGLSMAEKNLEKGNYDAAAGAVIRMIPHITGYKKLTRDPIINRAMRVLAVATARKNGKLNIGREIPKDLYSTWLGEDKAERDANLTWAVARLDNLNDAKKSDAVAESELAEAMAKLDTHKSQGKAKLETLAKKDLLTSPEAFNVLAELRQADGDATGANAAWTRCRQMATNEAVCTGATTPAKATATVVKTDTKL